MLMPVCYLLFFSGGLKGSSLIANNLICHYIPFLPLEKNHVRQCIADDLRQKGYIRDNFQNVVDKVMEQLSFAPVGVEVYSSSGCKRVFAKVNLVLEEIFH